MPYNWKFAHKLCLHIEGVDCEKFGRNKLVNIFFAITPKLNVWKLNFPLKRKVCVKFLVYAKQEMKMV